MNCTVRNLSPLGHHCTEFEPPDELHCTEFEPPDELLGHHCTEIEPPDELVGDHCTEFEPPDELVGDHCTKFESLVEVVIDYWVELQSPGELVGEHPLKFQVVVKFETSADHHLRASESLPDRLSGSVLVAQKVWMAVDSPHLEHHNSWMQVLDNGHPARYEDSSGNLKLKMHGDSIKPHSYDFCSFCGMEFCILYFAWVDQRN